MRPSNLKGRLVALAAGLALLLLGGCAESTEPLTDTIWRYNSLLGEGYRNLDMSRLSLVATKGQAEKVYHHMAALGEGRMKMVAVLDSMDFLAVEPDGPARARVVTEEQWDYRYANIDTGHEAMRNTVSYRLRYHLQRTDGIWQVGGIDIINTTNLDGGKTLPFLERPLTAVPGQGAPGRQQAEGS